MLGNVELVFDAKAQLGEGPSWDREQQVLYWVDIEGKKVNIFDPSSGKNREIPVDQRLGAVVPRNSGGAIAAMENGYYTLDLETGETRPIIDPEEGMTENRFNDGKCDPEGRFWAGTMSYSGIPENGALYCLDTHMKVEKKVDHVSTSNGLAWSPDHHFMYFIDTPTKQVVRYEYDQGSGTIQNPAIVVEIPDGEGKPDGMTIDMEGNLWIAHWGGSKVSVWNPDKGEQLRTIPVPALNVTSCAFGGKEMNELYITTASVGMEEEDLRKYPSAGGLFKVKTEVTGAPSYPFKG
ncbi:SMP-30/gluconolactonase/LRE family protein [Thalassobacillus devorans]|uniref:SMP-30/gluconolactonase/LRE family protein n=1 Tax=Thalassobacillus devorans TaxID=279813 RepID=UPI000A1CACFB|nr:SMP-30/gluconolactonase/LRE family protein [Thalassobacillus devorans]